ncbi:MAG TPA: hypothetical protein VNM47_14305 [Terriglobia bacterium]|nr:hypothetical protein [Terriglobia bacterium]
MFVRILLTAAFVIAAQGHASLWAWAAPAATMPADFAAAFPHRHAATGNPSLDAFYEIEDALTAGGNTARQNWQQLKGQPLRLVGNVDSLEKGKSPDTYLVRVDITPHAKGHQGIYDIVLRDSQPGVKYLRQGDPIRFQGKITSYTEVPNFILKLDAKIDLRILDKERERQPFDIATMIAPFEPFGLAPNAR